ncbi:MAG: hypothetical protein CL678_02215 [Bdellovibrionaceae bacterium]|nr:hypothetical protein [Pseudobdellovibrionaceae bacterium]|tara:strand:+ start:13927 stop:14652 length:726 start_codon:yes stop_codon:yes gene_type:complete
MAQKLPEYVKSALAKGLKLHAEGLSGAGLVEATVAAARRGISTGVWSDQKILKASAWFARHEADRARMRDPSSWNDPPRYSPAYVAWLLWGSKADNRGRRWIDRKAKEIKELYRGASTPAPPADRIKGGKNTGKASGSSGGKIMISDATNSTLRSKAREHNEKHGEDKAKRVSLRMLQKVYLRGAGAYSTSHRPTVRSRAQWAIARVNAFLRLVRVGRPKNPKYITDNDLLPVGHPRSPRK